SLIGLAYYGWPYLQNYLHKEEITKIAQPSSPDGIDFNALKAINPDTVGWLKIDGTAIDYPVVQTDNNDKYLYTTFEGEESQWGAVFLDYTYDFNRVPIAQNSVLYGHSHNIQKSSTFGDLHNYLDQNFYVAHKIIEYDRLGDPGQWEIFSIYKTEADYDYRRPDFADDADFMAYFKGIQDRSMYQTGVVIDPNDEILTLSTCVFDMDDGRLVVTARKIK
ncbi:MAG: class B sortase, partial [Eubacterium sp.]